MADPAGHSGARGNQDTACAPSPILLQMRPSKVHPITTVQNGDEVVVHESPRYRSTVRWSTAKRSSISPRSLGKTYGQRRGRERKRARRFEQVDV